MKFARLLTHAFAFALLLLFGGGAYAASDGPAKTEAEAQAILNSLHQLSGKISLAKGIAELNTGDRFYYFNSKDAATFLTKVLGNPPSSVEGVEGVIIPADASQNWFAVVDYSPEGHVKDNDAATINYDDLLKEMQADAVEQSKQRRSEGYGGLEIVGWAQKPSYDSASKKLYWAKSVRFEGSPGLTLNYDVRILGREGYVNIRIVDDIDQLDKINAQVPAILSTVNFTKNNTYTDYVESTDRTAAYGIAGLVAGGILAKVGFFKGLLLFAAAFWKVAAVFVVGAFAAISGFVRRLFRRKSEG